LFAVIFLLGIATIAVAVPPNIVVITADNLGYGDVGCYGNAVIKTPRIDALARQGVRCTDFYTASPTCTVSRASLLTGRYPQRHGLTNQLPGLDGNYGVGLRHSEVLLPQLLRPLGYRTACFGKWNIGFAAGSRPTERGFDEFFGHASGNIDYYTHVYNGQLDMHRGTEPADVEGYSVDLFADEACGFIRRNAAVPFFIYLPLNAPHFPNAKNKAPGEPTVWQAPDAAFAKYGYDRDTADEQERYRAVVTACDAAIGRVIDQLDEAGLGEQTLVVFFSDNGAFMLENRGLEVASNFPLRDGGVTLWEGGIRVPCVVRWPGTIPPGSVCREPLLSCDIFTMAILAAGGQLPSDRTIDGRDPTAALSTAPLSAAGSSPHDALFFQFRKYAAMRRGRYKIVRTTPTAAFELYDLHNDLGETTDLAAKQPQRVSEMRGQLQRWQRGVRDN
jgi:arylsulfatase A